MRKVEDSNPIPLETLRLAIEFEPCSINFPNLAPRERIELPQSRFVDEMLQDQQTRYNYKYIYEITQPF